VRSVRTVRSMMSVRPVTYVTFVVRYNRNLRVVSGVTRPTAHLPTCAHEQLRAE
jgi:hypothetical protein